MSSARRCAASVEEVKERINVAFGQLFRTNAAGERVPYVCLICDEFLKPQTMKTVSVDLLHQCKSLLSPSDWNDIDPNGALATSYTYFGECGDNVENDNRDWIDKMLLSPRGCYLQRAGTRQVEGFAVCPSCKYGLDHFQMPKFAIANNYCFGGPPSCLLELTDVELAMITPVKTYGYCLRFQTKESPREDLLIKGKQQLPLLVNNATTGHKLQGSGVDTLFVHNWSKVTNWSYVMLSRVKTRAGFFCHKKLGSDLGTFAVPEGLRKMLERFQHLRPTYW